MVYKDGYEDLEEDGREPDPRQEIRQFYMKVAETVHLREGLEGQPEEEVHAMMLLPLRSGERFGVSRPCVGWGIPSRTPEPLELHALEVGWTKRRSFTTGWPFSWYPECFPADRADDPMATPRDVFERLYQPEGSHNPMTHVPTIPPVTACRLHRRLNSPGIPATLYQRMFIDRNKAPTPQGLQALEDLRAITVYCDYHVVCAGVRLFSLKTVQLVSHLEDTAEDRCPSYESVAWATWCDEQAIHHILAQEERDLHATPYRAIMGGEFLGSAEDPDSQTHVMQHED